MSSYRESYIDPDSPFSILATTSNRSNWNRGDPTGDTSDPESTTTARFSSPHGRRPFPPVFVADSIQEARQHLDESQETSDSLLKSLEEYLKTLNSNMTLMKARVEGWIDTLKATQKSQTGAMGALSSIYDRYPSGEVWLDADQEFLSEETGETAQDEI